MAGIGFTVSFFNSGLAYDGETVVSEAKIGVLAASVVAAVLNATIVARTESPSDTNKSLDMVSWRIGRVRSCDSSMTLPTGLSRSCEFCDRSVCSWPRHRGVVIVWYTRKWQHLVLFVLVLPLKLGIEKGIVKQLVEREPVPLGQPGDPCARSRVVLRLLMGGLLGCIAVAVLVDSALFGSSDGAAAIEGIRIMVPSTLAVPVGAVLQRGDVSWVDQRRSLTGWQGHPGGSQRRLHRLL